MNKGYLIEKYETEKIPVQNDAKLYIEDSAIQVY